LWANRSLLPTAYTDAADLVIHKMPPFSKCMRFYPAIHLDDIHPFYSFNCHDTFLINDRIDLTPCFVPSTRHVVCQIVVTRLDRKSRDGIRRILSIRYFAGYPSTGCLICHTSPIFGMLFSFIVVSRTRLVRIIHFDIHTPTGYTTC
jgi:hypothetical protein